VLWIPLTLATLLATAFLPQSPVRRNLHAIIRFLPGRVFFSRLGTVPPHNPHQESAPISSEQNVADPISNVQMNNISNFPPANAFNNIAVLNPADSYSVDENQNTSSTVIAESHSEPFQVPIGPNIVHQTSNIDNNNVANFPPPNATDSSGVFNFGNSQNLLQNNANISNQDPVNLEETFQAWEDRYDALNATVAEYYDSNPNASIGVVANYVTEIMRGNGVNLSDETIRMFIKAWQSRAGGSGNHNRNNNTSSSDSRLAKIAEDQQVRDNQNLEFIASLQSSICDQVKRELDNMPNNVGGEMMNQLTMGVAADPPSLMGDDIINRANELLDGIQNSISGKAEEFVNQFSNENEQQIREANANISQVKSKIMEGLTESINRVKNKIEEIGENCIFDLKSMQTALKKSLALCKRDQAATVVQNAASDFGKICGRKNENWQSNPAILRRTLETLNRRYGI
jgi:hypothetical protein